MSNVGITGPAYKLVAEGENVFFLCKIGRRIQKKLPQAPKCHLHAQNEEWLIYYEQLMNFVQNNPFLLKFCTADRFCLPIIVTYPNLVFIHSS